MNAITITPDFDGRTAVITGECFGGERVSVTLASCASLLTDDLRFRVSYAGALLAAFPLEDGDEFAEDGDDLTFTLTLNTTPVLRALKAAGGGEIWCDFSLDDIGDARTLYFSSKKNIGEWRLSPGDGTPASLDDYRSAKQLDDKIEALANSLSGESIPARPTARETAEAAKKLVKALGGEVADE